MLLFEDCSSHLDPSKTWPLRGGAYFPYISIKKTLKIFLSETTGSISISFCRNVPLVILYQEYSSHLDSSKNTAAMVWGLFSLNIYIEKFKNLLVRNQWTNFNIILQKCTFGDPLPRLFKPFRFVKNRGCQGRGLFSLYIYIGNFKNLLVRNHWTDSNIILQKCSFGDPLPRLFKPF